MHAMILAAGFGTRMRPLSDRVAKPALPFMGRPLIGHTLRWLASHGVTDVVMNLHHLPEQVRQVATAECPTGVSLTFVDEPEIRGTGGGLAGAAAHLPDDEPVILVNGDIFTELDLSAVLAVHTREQPLATLALNGDDAHFELFSVGLAVPDIGEGPEAPRGDAASPQNGRILDFWGDPPGAQTTHRWAFTGVAIVSAELRRRLPAEGFACIKEAAYLPAVREGEHLHGVLTSGPWFDLGTPARYLDAHRAMLPDAERLTGLTELAPQVWGTVPPPHGVLIRPPVVLGPEPRLHLGASIGPNVVLGAGAEVKPGAQVNDAVLWDQAVVEDGAWDAIVAPFAIARRNPDPES